MKRLAAALPVVLTAALVFSPAAGRASWTPEAGPPDGGQAVKAEKPAEEPVRKPEKPAPTSGPDAPVSPEPKQPAELGSGLKRVGPGSYEITRDEFSRLMFHSPFIARQLWVRKVRKEGKLIGYKLKHIKKGSLPHKAGFRNGDVVIRIAGRTLHHPERLLLEIPGKDEVVVVLYRAGKRRKFTYRIVPL